MIGYFISNYGESPLLVGIAGLIVGLLLPNLRWWSWLLIGFGLGLLSVLSATFLLYLSPYGDLDSPITSYATIWLVNVLVKLIPLVILLYLAIRMNARE